MDTSDTIASGVATACAKNCSSPWDSPPRLSTFRPPYPSHPLFHPSFLSRAHSDHITSLPPLYTHPSTPLPGPHVFFPITLPSRHLPVFPLRVHSHLYACLGWLLSPYTPNPSPRSPRSPPSSTCRSSSPSSQSSTSPPHHSTPLSPPSHQCPVPSLCRLPCPPPSHHPPPTPQASWLTWNIVRKKCEWPTTMMTSCWLK